MRYGAELDKAIREALVAGMRPSELLRRLRAGTFRGYPAYPELADRTFYARWKKAKEERSRERSAEPGIYLLDIVAIERRAAELGTSDPATVAEGTGYTVEQVGCVLDPEVTWHELGAHLEILERAEALGTSDPGRIAAGTSFAPEQVAAALERAARWRGREPEGVAA